jgi:hypothetical protein
VDARQLSGNLTGAATLVITMPVTLLLGPAQITVTANPAFKIQGNGNAPPLPIPSLTVIGLDPNASVIVAGQANITLFELSGNIVPMSNNIAGETLTIKRCGLCGGNLGGNGGLAGTVAVNTQSYPTTNFEQGLLLVEDSLLTNFGDTALKIGASVYFNRIHRNYFLANNQAISLDNNTESSITENWFMQGPDGGPTITSIGPMHRIVHNYFYRNTLGDLSYAPDILLKPQAGWPSQAGGYVWIEDNRFGDELENLDPRRRRIMLAASDPTLIAGPAIIRGNQFFGPAVQCTISVPAASTTATVTLTGGYVTNGLAPLVPVTIYNAANLQLNGTFKVQSVTPPTQFTYTLPNPTTAASVGAGVRLAAAAAIETDNPHLPWDVHGNYFVDYGVLIADNESTPRNQNAAYGWGESLFVDNRVFCPNGGYKVFSNGGNNFTWIRPPANSANGVLDPWPKQIEARSLNNRVPQSEGLNLWPSNGVTVSPPTPGQADPFGTKRAFLLTLSGTTGSQNVASPVIDLNNLPASNRLVIKFWAKPGSLNSLLVGLLANNTSWYGNLFPVSLGSDWKQYKFVTNQLYSTSDTFTLVFYPGDISFASGTVYLFAPQVSDDDTDYIPTGGTSASDSSAGNRFEKAVILTSVKTETHSGGTNSAPTVAATNLGTGGSVTLQPGSTDFSGVIVLQAGTGAQASGQVTLSFNVPYTGTNPPVVVVTLQDGTTPWAQGTSQVRVLSSSGQSCVLAWVNGSALANAKTYEIAYVVIGRA